MTDEELIELLRTAEEWAGRPFTSAPELSEKVGLSRQAVHQRLQQVVDEHRNIRKYKPGQSAIYWFDQSR
jgi:biotin operon repressor